MHIHLMFKRLFPSHHCFSSPKNNWLPQRHIPVARTKQRMRSGDKTRQDPNMWTWMPFGIIFLSKHTDLDQNLSDHEASLIWLVFYSGYLCACKQIGCSAPIKLSVMRMNNQSKRFEFLEEGCVNPIHYYIKFIRCIQTFDCWWILKK